MPNLLKYCRATNAVPVLAKIRSVINIVPLERVVDNLAHEMSATMPQGEFPLRFLHEMGDVNISLTDLKSYTDAETGNTAAHAGIDKMLVAFFKNLCNMPPTTWQRLIKNKRS